jgi:hypothetical protein
MPAKSFFRSIAVPAPKRDAPSHPWLYLSQEVDRLDEARPGASSGRTLEAALQPLDELLSAPPGADAAKSSVNLWAGGEGVVTPCHYDGYHNLFAQLRGRKRFTLVAPDAWPFLRPYPFLHPHHAQCQRRPRRRNVVSAAAGNKQGLDPPGGLNPPPTQDSGLTPRVQRLEAVLEARDLLYIPPMWFHEAETLGPLTSSKESVPYALSVNVWTGVPEETVASELARLPPLTQALRADLAGLEARGLRNARGIALCVALFSALERACGGAGRAEALLRATADARYSALVEAQVGRWGFWRARASTGAPLATELPHGSHGSEHGSHGSEHGSHSSRSPRAGALAEGAARPRTGDRRAERAGAGLGPGGSSAGGSSAGGSGALGDSVVGELCPSAPSGPGADAAAATARLLRSPAHADAIDAYASRVAQLAARLHPGDASTARRDIWLGNFAEHAAAIALAEGAVEPLRADGPGDEGSDVAASAALPDPARRMAAAGAFLRSVEGCARFVRRVGVSR